MIADSKEIRVLDPAGKVRASAPVSGMRSIAVFDGDGDGRVDVFMGDGWHQNYGDNARGLLTWARYQNGGFKTELIEDTQGQYAIENIVPATIDGKPAIVAVGSHSASVPRDVRPRETLRRISTVVASLRLDGSVAQ